MSLLPFLSSSSLFTFNLINLTKLFTKKALLDLAGLRYQIRLEGIVYEERYARNVGNKQKLRQVKRNKKSNRGYTLCAMYMVSEKKMCATGGKHYVKNYHVFTNGSRGGVAQITYLAFFTTWGYWEQIAVPRAWVQR